MKKLALALTLACLLCPTSTRAQNAYITNQNSNTVSVIDTATDMVIATIPVGLSPFGVAVSPDGSKVYVTNEFSTTVSVIDTATNTVSATIPVGLPPPILWRYLCLWRGGDPRRQQGLRHHQIPRLRSRHRIDDRYDD